MARRRSLRFHLGVSFVGVLVLTLLVVGSGLYFMVGRYLVRAGVQRLRYLAVVGLHRPDNDVGADPDAEVDARLEDLDRDASVLAARIGTRLVPVCIVSEDGTVLGASRSVRHGPALDMRRLRQARAAWRIQAARKSRWGRRVLGPGVFYFDIVRGRRWQVLILPVHRGPQLLAFLQLSQRWREQDELLATLRFYLIGAGILAIAFGLLASFTLARGIAAPLEHLAATARRVASGDLGARARLGPGDDEVSSVAEAFDHMVERVQASFQAQRRFVADASHELKTPLTAIAGTAEVLALGAADDAPEKRARALATIGREVDKMSALVGDLLLLSRAEQGDEAPIDVRPIDVHALVEEAAAYAQVAGRAHRFQLDNPPGLWTRGDASQLSRVLRNLLDNAFKYTPAGGSVELRSRAEDGQIVLEVADNGGGIDPTDLPYVFDRFYRADRSRSRRTGGSGLGLAIVRAIVERHGGRVAVQSSVGQGSCFCVFLPGVG